MVTMTRCLEKPRGFSWHAVVGHKNHRSRVLA